MIRIVVLSMDRGCRRPAMLTWRQLNANQAVWASRTWDEGCSCATLNAKTLGFPLSATDHTSGDTRPEQPRAGPALKRAPIRTSGQSVLAPTARTLHNCTGPTVKGVKRFETSPYGINHASEPPEVHDIPFKMTARTRLESKDR